MKDSFVLLLALLCFAAQCSYFTYQKSHTFILGQSNSVTAFSLAPKDVSSSVFAININTALGLSNGTVLFSATQNYENIHSFNVCDGPIQKIQWNQISFNVVCEHMMKVYDPTSLQTKFNISLPSSAEYTAHAVKNAGLVSASVMTAICVANQISLYENSRYLKSLKTKSPCRAMSFDNKGKYFYYFDSHLRIIYNIETLSIYESYEVSSNYIAVVGATKTNEEDITASLDTDGYLYVWDDDKLLCSYNTGSQIQLKFNENSDFLVTLRSNNSLYIWRTSFTNYTTWSKVQQISLSAHSTLWSSGQIVGFEVKQSKILYVLKNEVHLYIYDSSNEGGQGNIFTAIFFALFCCCCFGAICTHLKRNRYRINCWALICWRTGEKFIIREPIPASDSYRPIGQPNNCTACRDANCNTCVQPPPSAPPSRNYNQGINYSINEEPRLQPNQYNRPADAKGNYYPGPNTNQNNQQNANRPNNERMGPYNGYHNEGNFLANQNNNMNNFGPPANNMNFNNNSSSNQKLGYNQNGGQQQYRQNMNFGPAPYNNQVQQNKGNEAQQQVIYKGQPLNVNPYGRNSDDYNHDGGRGPPKPAKQPEYRPPNH